jgi:hypothetical protein
MTWMPAIRLRRLTRTALLLGACALAAGASMHGVAWARTASAGSEPGALSITPSSGPSTQTGIAYASSTACPAGFQGSGIVRLVDPATGNLSNLSKVNPSVSVPFSGAFNTTFAVEEQVFPAIVGTTSEMVVDCFSGPSATGASEPVQSVSVSIPPDGATYQSGLLAQPGPASTVTSLVASPSPVTVGQTVTLTATVSDVGRTPTGTVQFEVGGTTISSPVILAGGLAGSLASTTTSFSAAGTEALSAVYTPANPAVFVGSTGTASLTVRTAPAHSGTQPLVASAPATGTFTLTVGLDTVNLTVSADGSAGAGTLETITVDDSRDTNPGWLVSGQDSDWAGTGTAVGGTISGNQLGWTPTSTALAQGVTLGPVVTPAAPGLGTTAAILASVHAGTGNGFGTSTFGAGLTLAIPPTSPAGPYTSTLTITAVTSNP